MPVLNSKNMDTHGADGTGYGFSAAKVEDLGASEYTLVGITADVSGSVHPFRDEIEACVKEVVRACVHSPRADNLMLRLVAFDNGIHEIHGFKPLTQCQPDDYNGVLMIGGTTALFDAAVNVTESVTRYGKDLVDQDFEANGIVFVITDGMNNAGKSTVDSLKKALERAVTSEALESMVSVLIGVNTDADSGLNQYLEDIHRDAGFTQYVAIGKANAKTLAKLADFVSRSISSQSQALGTGAPSQSLSF